MDSITAIGVWATLVTVAIGLLTVAAGLWKQAQKQGAQANMMEADHRALDAAHEKIRALDKAQQELHTNLQVLTEKVNQILAMLQDLRTDFKDHHLQEKR
jgi:inhibitor of KinA sporulation pathway (predicted exonuclease)